MRRGIAGTCKWCGRDDVRRPAIYWHRECADLYLLHTRPEVQKRHLIKRDGRRCGQCGDVPQKWLPGQVYALCSTNAGIGYWPDQRQADEFRAAHWARPGGRWDELTHEERHTGDQQSIERVCALEVDHRVPLWSIAHLPLDERRPYFGPTNLWLLCPRCHKEKSRREAADRAAVRRAA